MEKVTLQLNFSEPTVSGFLFQTSGHVLEPDNIEKSNTFGGGIWRNIGKKSNSTLFPFHATVTDYCSSAEK